MLIATTASMPASKRETHMHFCRRSVSTYISYIFKKKGRNQHQQEYHPAAQLRARQYAEHQPWRTQCSSAASDFTPSHSYPKNTHNNHIASTPQDYLLRHNQTLLRHPTSSIPPSPPPASFHQQLASALHPVATLNCKISPTHVFLPPHN